MTEPEKRYDAYVCPKCGEQLDPYDFVGGSITDADHPVDGLGVPLCWECLNEDEREVHYNRVEVIPVSVLEELQEERTAAREAVALIHESTNDPRILAITRRLLQSDREEDGR